MWHKMTTWSAHWRWGRPSHTRRASGSLTRCPERRNRPWSRAPSSRWGCRTALTRSLATGIWGGSVVARRGGSASPLRYWWGPGCSSWMSLPVVSIGMYCYISHGIYRLPKWLICNHKKIVQCFSVLRYTDAAWAGQGWPDSHRFGASAEQWGVHPLWLSVSSIRGENCLLWEGLWGMWGNNLRLLLFVTVFLLCIWDLWSICYIVHPAVLLPSWFPMPTDAQPVGSFSQVHKFGFWQGEGHSERINEDESKFQNFVSSLVFAVPCWFTSHDHCSPFAYVVWKIWWSARENHNFRGNEEADKLLSALTVLH